eukprot:2543599-Prorocentrum_lima.AAC.1
MTSSLVGSEMCIRDRHKTVNKREREREKWLKPSKLKLAQSVHLHGWPTGCLLYTSDAADDM